jgi:hypothetical protein
MQILTADKSSPILQGLYELIKHEVRLLSVEL